LGRAWLIYITILTAIGSTLGYFRIKQEKPLVGWWGDLSPWWGAILPVLVVAVVLFLLAVHKRFEEVEKERDKLREGKTTRDKRAALKDALATLDERGHEVYTGNPSVEEAEKWVNDAGRLIYDALGNGEARLFMSDAGYTFRVSQNDTRQMLWVLGRLRRLAELMARVDSIELLPDFDIQDFKNRIES
jgi:hypothetical protein